MAYKLSLPPTSKIHPVFHVSLLKPHHGETPTQHYPLPEFSIANKPLMIPLAILATRTIQHNNNAVKQVLVQWSTSPPEDATWEDLTTFCQIYQLPNLEDKVDFEGESGVSGLGPTKETGPIHLDQSAIHKRAQELITEAEQIKEGDEVAERVESHEEEKEASQDTQMNKREGRARRKPSWLKDFIMYAKS